MLNDTAAFSSLVFDAMSGAGTQVGLLVSEDSGTTWTSTATPANVTIDEMFFADTGFAGNQNIKACIGHMIDKLFYFQNYLPLNLDFFQKIAFFH